VRVSLNCQAVPTDYGDRIFLRDVKLGRDRYSKCTASEKESLENEGMTGHGYVWIEIAYALDETVDELEEENGFIGMSRLDVSRRLCFQYELKWWYGGGSRKKSRDY
jgi:hypothetical protein